MLGSVDQAAGFEHFSWGIQAHEFAQQRQVLQPFTRKTELSGLRKGQSYEIRHLPTQLWCL